MVVPERIVGYLLAALDAEETARVAGHLRTEGQAKKRLQLLSQSLEPLERAPGLISPPDGIPRRTCTKLRQARTRAQ